MKGTKEDDEEFPARKENESENTEGRRRKKAKEGKLIAVVASSEAEESLDSMISTGNGKLSRYRSVHRACASSA